VHLRDTHARPPAQRRTAGPRATPQSATDQLLDLQRQVGNQAFAMLVQRAPAGPAPTDAPGRRKPKPPKKSPPPKKTADFKARIIGFATDKEGGVITIAAGADQGVKVGMTGSLLNKDGAEYADFIIEKVTGTSVAHVKATQDQVSANPYVIIKASKFEDVDLRGKEF
jgi:hypothetical protein